MAENKKTDAKQLAKPTPKSSTPKPPKKLIPRTAPKIVVASPESTVEPIAAPAVGAAGLAKPVVKRVPKIDVELEATNARNKQAMSDALAKVMAVKIAQPLGVAVPAPDLPLGKKPKKASKPKKVKLVRDSYAMPESEYAAIAELKKRLVALGSESKKSELLRGGVMALAAMSDMDLLAAISRVERIKTGRPVK